MPISDLLPELSLLAGVIVIILFASFAAWRRQPLAAGLALIALAFAALFSFFQWQQLSSRLTFSGVWALDTPSLAAKLLVIFTGAVTVALSPDWVRDDRRQGEYYALCLFSCLGAIMMASANDLMELVTGVLLSSTANYPLIAFHRRFTPALEAGLKFFLIGALATSLLALGVVLLFGIAGDTAYPRIEEAIRLSFPTVMLSLAVTCVVVGLTFKLGAFPAHAWMPDVAQGAPAPVAALTSVAPKIGAAVALARLVTVLPETIHWREVVAVISVMTMTLGNLAALRQDDLRRLLGWSSVSQSGYALMAIVVIGRAEQATTALLVFLAAYALANVVAFAVVTHLRGRTSLDDYHGLATAQPFSAAAMILALLSLAGIPPLAGFFGKFILFKVTLEAGFGWLAVIAVANTVVSMFYYLRVAALMMFRSADSQVHTLGQWSRWSAAASLVALLAASFGAEPGFSRVALAVFAGQE